MKPARTCWRRNLRPSIRRLRSKSQTRRSARVVSLLSSLACRTFSGEGDRGRSFITRRIRRVRLGQPSNSRGAKPNHAATRSFVPPLREAERGSGGEASRREAQRGSVGAVPLHAGVASWVV